MDILVGAFSFEEKSPTITVASFFFFFFVRPQTSSRMHHCSQTSLSLTCTRQYLVYGNPAVTGSSPCFCQKRFRPISLAMCDSFNFFRNCATFFENFFCRQRVPPSSFLIFCSKLKFQKPKGSPF